VLVRAAGTLAALLVLTGGAATAGGTGTATFAKDRRGDVDGPLDVVRVALGKVSGGMLRAEITMASPWSADDLRSDAAPASLCLRLYAKIAPDAGPPDHLVCATAPAAGDELVGQVLRDRSNGLPRKLAGAAVSRPTERTVFLRFAEADIGRPARVTFSAEAITRGEGCPMPLGCRDLGPDAAGATELPLRSTADHR
jgi:hypothetical protein